MAELADGFASPSERTRIETHIDACPDCSELIAEALRRGADPEQHGRYRIVGEIGHGAMGRVYRARDPELQRDVALKVMRNEDPLLVREARALATLSDPNVVEVFDVGEVRGRVFIAMELIEGSTLGAWLAGKPHWREVVSVFTAAGRGLVAVHAAGLVHRDFKPSNVMLASDGRVRVTDFGLVRRSSLLHGTRASSDNGDAGTLDGFVVGTPAYMAPEQHDGDPGSAASDQFAFCVALFEALCGQRPFVGGAETMASDKAAGRWRFPAAAQALPRWLRRIVERGLEPIAVRRFPSMGALVQRLERGGSRWTLYAGAGAVAMLAIGSFAARDRRECAEVDLAWDETRSSELIANLQASPYAIARDDASEIAERLDRYGAAWATAHRDACGSDTIDREMACLGRARAELASVVDSLSRPLTADAARAARSAVIGLPNPARCSEAGDAPTPGDPEQSRTVQRIREELAAASALLRAARYDAASEQLALLAPQVAATNFPALEAELAFQEGWLRDSLGDYEAATDAFTHAYLTAQMVGDDRLAADAVTRVVYEFSDRLGRTDLAQEWMRHADAQLERAGSSDELVVLAERARGSMLARLGRYQDAAIAYEHERSKLRADDQHGRALVHSNLGAVLTRLGRYEESRAALENSLAIYEELYGESHPNVIHPLGHLGHLHHAQGDLEASRRCFERALVLAEATLDGDHPMVAGMLNNLGAVASSQGDHEAAQRHFERALAILEATAGPDSLAVAKPLGNLASIALAQERLHDAERLAHRSLAIKEAAVGRDHPELLHPLSVLSDALIAQGRSDAALVPLRRAVAIESALKGADHPDLAATRARLARAEGSQHARKNAVRKSK